MTTAQIIIDIVLFFFALFVILVTFGMIKYIVDKIEERKSKELELKKTELYTLIDPAKLDLLISEWIHTYIRKYILTNYTIHNVNFVNKDMTMLMIKEVSSQIIVEMSDMYLVFIKLKYNLNRDEDLIKYVYNLVSDEALIAISDYNKSE